MAVVLTGQLLSVRRFDTVGLSTLGLVKVEGL